MLCSFGQYFRHRSAQDLCDRIVRIFLCCMDPSGDRRENLFASHVPSASTRRPRDIPTFPPPPCFCQPCAAHRWHIFALVLHICNYLLCYFLRGETRCDLRKLRDGSDDARPVSAYPRTFCTFSHIFAPYVENSVSGTFFAHFRTCSHIVAQFPHIFTHFSHLFRTFSHISHIFTHFRTFFVWGGREGQDVA